MNYPLKSHEATGINHFFRSNFTLSKTEEYGSAIDSECPTNEYNSDEEEGEGHIMRPDETKRTSFKPLTGFAWVSNFFMRLSYKYKNLDWCPLFVSVFHSASDPGRVQSKPPPNASANCQVVQRGQPSCRGKLWCWGGHNLLIIQNSRRVSSLVSVHSLPLQALIKPLRYLFDNSSKLTWWRSNGTSILPPFFPKFVVEWTWVF